MAETILAIFEGERTEAQIFESLERHFLADHNVNIVTFKTNIYELYNRLKDVSEGEFLDAVGVLKEGQENLQDLDGVSADDVSQIFLFFDYDGHVPGACDEYILELLRHFDEETDNGKLYVSYPMAEALKHMPDDDETFRDLCVDVIDIAPNTSKYKQRAHIEEGLGLRDFANLSSEQWKYLLERHCKKANYITHNDFSLNEALISSQLEIFGKQCTEYIEPHGRVSVLSGFPLFLAEYHGPAWLLRLVD
jgi:hypothetical protein